MKRIHFQESEILQIHIVKYLSLHLDNKLNKIQEKVKQIKTSRKSMNWLAARSSKLKTRSKLQIYKTITKPIWILDIWNSNLGHDC